MARTALKWTLGAILSVVGFFIAGVLVVGYIQGRNTLPGLISGIVIGSVFFIPGLILLILALIDVSHNAFDMRVARVLEEKDRVTPSELARLVNSKEEKVEAAVSRILEKGLIIVYFDKATGEFVTQEGRAIGERIIGIVKSKRRTTLEEICMETGMTAEEVKRIIIGMKKRGLFEGIYDWKKGKILSKEAVELLAKAKTHCPNCGGTLAEPPLPGEEIKCEYCGSLITG
jgi:hypothetical protein